MVRVSDPSPLAAAPVQHAVGQLLSQHEAAGQVDLQHLAPGVQRELAQRRPELHAGVVDQHVDPAQLGVQPPRLGDDRVGVGHVERAAVDIGPRHLGRQLVAGLADPGLVPAVQDHGRTRPGQPGRHGRADAPGGSGDQRAPPGQVEG
jgi:hypothetical protein